MSLSADFKAHIPAAVRKVLGHNNDYKVTVVDVKEGVMHKSFIPYMVHYCKCSPVKNKHILYPEEEVRIRMSPVDMEVAGVGMFRYWIGRCGRCDMLYVAGTLLQPF